MRSLGKGAPHPPDGPGAPNVAGKTIGDVLYDILSRPLAWLAFFGLLLGIAGLALACIEVATHLFGVHTSEIQLGTSDSHIVLQSSDSKGGDQYLVIVDPHGWQPSGITLRKGDRVTFSAGGRVCIDMGDIQEKIQLRKNYEEAWAKKEQIRPNDDKETRVPEDFFTEEEKKSLILNRPWVDPEGFSLNKFQPSFRARKERYLLPDKPAGALAGALVADAEEPGKSSAFFIGRQMSYNSEKDGVLWFTVNDVQFSNSDNPNLFYNDNIGAFWVKILVTH